MTKPIRAVALLLLAAACACSPKGGAPDGAAGLCAVSPRGALVAGSPMTWEIRCKTPRQGFAPHASILVAFPHPYYNMRPANMLPQIENPSAPGHAIATVNGKPAALRFADIPLMPRALVLDAGNAGWKGKDEIIIALGRGPKGEPTFQAPKMLADSFAPLVLVDPDGRGLYKESDAAGEGARITPAGAVKAEIVAPSVLMAGEPFEATVRFMDEFGNIAPPPRSVEARFSAEAIPTPAAPATVAIGEDEPATAPTSPSAINEQPPGYNPPAAAVLQKDWARVPAGSFKGPAYYYLTADFGGAFPPATSNPILVAREKSPKRVYFGDIHGHTNVSDGLNSPESYYDVAEGPAALAFSAVTDHEWQIDQGEWERIAGLCRDRAKQGRFVPLLAWEFSFGGHGIVYYDNCDAHPLLPPEGPRKLWEVAVNGARPFSWTKARFGFIEGHGDKSILYGSLPQKGATFIPHTSATRDMGDDWDSFDPDRTAAVEIYSSHGSDESADDPRRVEPFAPGGAVFAALNRGFRLGFVAASDGHDSRPGLSRWGRYAGGLTAVEANALTRRTVFDAIAGGRTYATTGPRIILRASMSGRRPGQLVTPDGEPVIAWEAAGEAPFARVEVVKNGVVAHTEEFADAPRVIRGDWRDEQFDGPAWYVVRVTQSDGERAWSSPFYARHPTFAALRRFSARLSEHAVDISWETIPGDGTTSFTLLKRLGNDGGGDPALYADASGRVYPAGPVSYRDVEPLKPGVTAWYILSEKNLFGTLRFGPVAVHSARPAEALDQGRWKLGYFVLEAAPVRVTIRDTEGRTVRSFSEGQKAPGDYELVWDGLDAEGRAVPGLCFYTVYVGTRESPRKPILAMPEP